MEMKKYILLALLASCTIIVNAQQFKWGVRGALNISSMGEYEHPLGQYEDSELNSRLGFYGGIFGQLYFTEKLGIETGLFFAQLGGKDKENDYDESYKITANPSYLQLPITVFYKFNLPAGFQIYPALGYMPGMGYRERSRHVV